MQLAPAGPTNTVVFGAFPRTGLPRRYASYEDWVRSVDVLVRGGAIPDPSYLWWDLRLQPRYGTIEIRIMDAQTTVDRTAALAAVVQTLAHRALHALDDAESRPGADEVLAENRFLALRDGVEARFVDPDGQVLAPVSEQADTLMQALRPHAQAAGCAAELERVALLCAAPAAGAQREHAAAHGIDTIAADLAQRFAAAPERAAHQPAASADA